MGEVDFYQHLLDTLYDGVYYVDPQRRIRFWNKAAEQLTGFSTAEMVGRACGDDAGDAVLKMMGATLKVGSRSYDFPGRWGGEEFLMVAPNIDAQVLSQLGERMRMLIAESSLSREGGRLSATVSIGGTIVRDSDDMESIVRRADQLMYQSKNDGRNRVTIG